MKQWKIYVLSYVWGFLFVAQIILVFIFGIMSENRLDVVMYIGVAIWWFAVILAWLPIFILKRKGGVPNGKSFVRTTVIVESGLYSIIRHPQYMSGILFSFSLILISQNWVIAAMSVVIITLSYIDILNADKHEVEKFGDAYKDYMEKVPRINFLLGIIKLLRRRKKIAGN